MHFNFPIEINVYEGPNASGMSWLEVNMIDFVKEMSLQSIILYSSMILINWIKFNTSMEQQQKYDFAIIGGGVYGLSIAYHLSKCQKSVALF